jgi:hypothetical protein
VHRWTCCWLRLILVLLWQLLTLSMQAVRCKARTTAHLPALLCYVSTSNCCMQVYQIMTSWALWLHLLLLLYWLLNVLHCRWPTLTAIGCMSY